jgi:hypothetical protein
MALKTWSIEMRNFIFERTSFNSASVRAMPTYFNYMSSRGLDINLFLETGEDGISDLNLSKGTPFSVALDIYDEITNITAGLYFKCFDDKFFNFICANQINTDEIKEKDLPPHYHSDRKLKELKEKNIKDRQELRAMLRGDVQFHKDEFLEYADSHDFTKEQLRMLDEHYPDSRAFDLICESFCLQKSVV